MKKILALTTLAISVLSTTPAQAGVASATYYSDYYQGRKMANGRRFNQHALTAAHPSLRLGTRLKVYNPKTRKAVFVTVTDRCHCSLDLSKAAFQRIASLRQGRVRVYISKY